MTIIRGAGKSFCAGYDLDMKRNVAFPIFEAEGEGMFMRHVLNGENGHQKFDLLDSLLSCYRMVHDDGYGEAYHRSSSWVLPGRRE